MKRIIFIALIILLIDQGLLHAQENIHRVINGKIGITFSSFGNNDIFRFKELHGAAGYDADHFQTLGISYVHTLKKQLEIETGFEYSRHSIIIKSNLPPNENTPSRKENFSLINIPVTLRANFLNYFFINGGFIMDIDASGDSPIDNQTGIGTLFGLAVKYDFDSGVSVFVNPYTKFHSLIPLRDRDYHQRIWENGVRMGLTYDLRKMK